MLVNKLNKKRGGGGALPPATTYLSMRGLVSEGTYIVKEPRGVTFRCEG